MRVAHRAKAILVGAQGSGDQHVAPGAHAAVAAQRHAVAQAVGGEGLQGRGVKWGVGWVCAPAALPYGWEGRTAVCSRTASEPACASWDCSTCGAQRHASAPLQVQLPSPAHLVHLCQSHLNGAAAVLDGGDGGGAGAAVVARDLREGREEGGTVRARRAWRGDRSTVQRGRGAARQMPAAVKGNPPEASQPG